MLHNHNMEEIRQRLSELGVSAELDPALFVPFALNTMRIVVNSQCSIEEAATAADQQAKGYLLSLLDSFMKVQREGSTEEFREALGFPLWDLFHAERVAAHA